MPSTSRKGAPDRELLLAQHSFPGEYIVKAFGPGNAVFKTAIADCAVAVVGTQRALIEERRSSRGARMCVTVTLHAENVDEVIEVYDRIYRDVADLMLIL